MLETYFRRRPYSEVAATLGIPEGTVKSRVYYALRALRLALEEMGWDDPGPDDHVRPLLGAFVLGHLDDTEAAAVRAHLEGCAPCRDEAAQLASVAELLPLADPAASVRRRSPAGGCWGGARTHRAGAGRGGPAPRGHRAAAVAAAIDHGGRRRSSPCNRRRTGGRSSR